MTDEKTREFFLQYIIGESEFQPLELIPAQKLSLKESLDIYNQDYYARLTDVLSEHYEATRNILGDELFFEICKLYIKSHKSPYWNINKYGEYFGEFILQLKEENTENSQEKQKKNLDAEFTAYSFLLDDYPFLPDLIQMEWKKQFLFHQKDEIGFEGNNLSAFSLENFEKLKLQFIAPFYLEKSNYNIPSIYFAARNQSEEPPMDWDHPSYWIQYKFQNQVFIKPVSLFIYLLTKGLFEGESMIQAIESAQHSIAANKMNSPEKEQQELQEYFSWISKQRLIAQIL